MMPRMFKYGYRLASLSVVILGVMVAGDLLDKFVLVCIDIGWVMTPRKFFIKTFYLGLAMMVCGGLIDRFRNRQ